MSDPVFRVMERSNPFQEQMLALIERLRRKVEAGEVRSLVAVTDNGPEGYDAEWTGAEDRFGLAGFMIAAAIERLKVEKAPL